jgi:tRNA wybutosine-synthesizing protein 1
MNMKAKKFVKITPARIEKYKNAGYRIIGKHQHSGVEICRWAKSVLRGGRNCYKGIYGVSSHRCLQMTPTLDFCTFNCKFCWRSFGKDRFKSTTKWDHPKEILDAAIAAQRNLMNGWKGNKLTTIERYNEAMKPIHVAISLDGEPTLYPKLPELIKEIKKRGMTAFLVTNGTMPNRLKDLLKKPKLNKVQRGTAKHNVSLVNAEPTNLYISVYATNPKDYQKITNSFLPNAFDRVLESLMLLKKFKEARTIMRLTLVRGLNLKDAEGWAKLIKLAEPDIVEFKGYTWLGESRQRLKREDMPSMQELEDFAKKITKLTKYKVKHNDNISRVIVFARDEETWKWSLSKIGEQGISMGCKAKSSGTGERKQFCH